MKTLHAIILIFISSICSADVTAKLSLTASEAASLTIDNASNYVHLYVHQTTDETQHYGNAATAWSGTYSYTRSDGGKDYIFRTSFPDDSVGYVDTTMVYHDPGGTYDMSSAPLGDVLEDLEGKQLEIETDVGAINTQMTWTTLIDSYALKTAVEIDTIDSASAAELVNYPGCMYAEAGAVVCIMNVSRNLITGATEPQRFIIMSYPEADVGSAHPVIKSLNYGAWSVDSNGIPLSATEADILRGSALSETIFRGTMPHKTYDGT